MESAERVDSHRAVEEPRELDGLAGGPDGARRVCWTNGRGRFWLREKLDEIDCEVEVDEAGNLWACPPSGSEEAVILGGHMDSVPNGGWLDGTLDTIAALEVLRSLARRSGP
jgi:N-carbamoyl-L-amino-acid hydrolase